MSKKLCFALLTGFNHFGTQNCGGHFQVFNCQLSGPRSEKLSAKRSLSHGFANLHILKSFSIKGAYKFLIINVKIWEEQCYLRKNCRIIKMEKSLISGYCKTLRSIILVFRQKILHPEVTEPHSL